MNIGIDIDGVLTNVQKFTIEEGKKYCTKTGKGKFVNPKAYDSAKIFNWDDETDSDFWLNNIFLYAKDAPIINGARKNIKKLKEDNCKIFIITSRWLATPTLDKKIENAEMLRKEMRNTVIEWLSKNSIEYDKLIFSDYDKSKHIIENKIDIMIEDCPKNLEELSKITKMICYNWNYNSDIKKDNIYRCYNWDEIYYKAKEISEMKDNKY